MSGLNDTVHVYVTDAEDPVGRLTVGIDEGFVWVKNVGAEIMWSVAPLSKIQGFVNIELIGALGKVNKPMEFA